MRRRSLSPAWVVAAFVSPPSAQSSRHALADGAIGQRRPDQVQIGPAELLNHEPLRLRQGQPLQMQTGALRPHRPPLAPQTGRHRARPGATQGVELVRQGLGLGRRKRHVNDLKMAG
jgi:hypothetical protein